MRTGDKVRLLRDVERFPHFIAKAGSTGTIVQLDDEIGGIVRVRMDARIPGAEEWDNEIIWLEELAVDFVDDVGLVPTGRFAHLDF